MNEIKKPVRYGWRMSDGMDLYEREAAIFARHLLVPTSLLRTEVQRMKIVQLSDKNLSVLAKKFQVETWVMMTRLIESKLITL